MRTVVDFSKFKKVSSDKHSTTLQHPEGHKIIIAHSPLSKDIRGQLESLGTPDKKMADGGEVNPKLDESKKEPEPAPSPTIKPAEMGGDYDPYEGKKPGELPKFAEGGAPEAPLEVEPIKEEQDSNPPLETEPVMSAPQPPSAEESVPAPMEESPGDTAAPAQPPAAAPAPQSASGPDLMGGYNKQVSGINQAASAEGQLGKDQASLLAKSVESQQKAAQTFQDSFNKLDSERKAFQQDIMNSHIDPSHYMANLDTGQRVATGIGLILGGLGAGGTDGRNLAMDVMQKNIDRDIDAQRMNLGKKESLLSANMRQFGNLHDATQMTRIMSADIVKNQLMQAAAKAQDPIVKARAMQAIGQLEQQVAPMVQQLSMRQALQAGGASQQDPASYVPYVVPEAHQKEVFTEVKNAQNAAKNKDAILQNFDTAASHSGKLVGVGPGAAAQKANSALFLPMIHDQEGRVNEYEQATLEKLMPTTGDSKNTIDAKRTGLIRFMENKASAPTAKAFGIDMQKFGSTASSPEGRLDPKHQAIVQWARQPENANNPRAQAALKALGIR